QPRAKQPKQASEDGGAETAPCPPTLRYGFFIPCARMVAFEKGTPMAAAAKRTFSLPAEHTKFIDAKVASGDYASGSEVVRAGLRALQERDAAVERWL